MVIGGRPAEAHWDTAEEAPAAIDMAYPEPEQDAAAELPRRTGTIVAAVAALLVAGAWIALVVYAARVAIRPSGDRLLDLFAIVPVASGPLALIAVGWLLLRRTSRREAYRFAATADAMRAEAAGMEAVLARIGGAIDANRRLLADQADQLLALGDAAGARLGAVQRAMAAEGEALDRRSEGLARAAASARSEMDALLTDLPHAETRSRAFAAVLRETGLGAHEQAGVLETQVAALVARGKEADESAGGAAQRLAAQLGRIEAHGGAATRELERATAALSEGVDAALAAAAAALGEARAGLGAQNAATLATIEAARAALASASEDAASAFSERLDRAAGRLDQLGRRLGEQDAAGRALVERLAGGLDAVDAQFVQLEEQGQARTAAMEQAVGALRGQTERAILAVGDGAVAIERLGERADALRATVDGIGREIAALPPSLAEVDAAARRSRAAVAEAGPETARLEAAARAAADRMARIQASYAQQQAAVDRIGASVTARIAEIEAHARALEDIEGRFERFGDAGAERTADLAEAIVALSGHAQSIAGTFGASVGEAEALAARIAGLESALAAIRSALGESLPAALADVADGAERARSAVARARPEAEALGAAIDRAADRVADLDAATAQRRAGIAAAADTAEARLTRLAAELEALREGLVKVGSEAGEVADAAAPRLVEAMLRVREAANGAAANARETLGAVIPAAAAALGEASREALDHAITARVEAQMAQIAEASERAVAAAHRATDRLMRQMLTIADTTSAVEARIAEAHGEIAAKDEDSFSRRVALLIESLNSTAIDVAKIFSADIADSAWAAYLRGDRGVFTRRAVRLLDGGDVREIVRHYDEQPAFRDQVNRYIHDFEAMLRRVLASRDGAPLGVTLLSSDMGKLYVALAQAIERLRS